MKYTLLEMTQTIMSSMDSDLVTSINDTPESLQVANVIRTAYFDMIDSAHLPETYTLFNLTETTSATPTLMSLPIGFESISDVMYDTKQVTDTAPIWSTMRYQTLKEFQDRMYSRRSDDSEITAYNITIGSSTIPIYAINNQHPQFYTTYDDSTIVFDAYDSAVETNLKSIKSQGYGRVSNTFTMTDGFEFPIDDDAQAQLLNEAKSLAWMELKQSPHQKAEQSARRHKISQQINKVAIKDNGAFDALPYYGRK